MANLNYPRTVKIHWSYPREYESAMSTDTSSEFGIYYISRLIKCSNDTNWWENETTIYVGQTKRTFSQRFKEHLKHGTKWTTKYGKKLIRFGTITNIRNFPDSEFDRKLLLEDIETAIIWSIQNEQGCKLENVQKVYSANPNYKLRIENTGYRGLIPSFIEPL